MNVVAFRNRYWKEALSGGLDAEQIAQKLLALFVLLSSLACLAAWTVAPHVMSESPLWLSDFHPVLALGLTILAFSLRLTRQENLRRSLRRLNGVLRIAAGGCGAVAVLGQSSPFLQELVESIWPLEKVPAVPSPAAGLSLTLLAMCASSRRARRNFLFPQMLCIAVGLLSLTTLLAHAYGAAGLSARWIMDPASAFLFLLVAAFLLLQLSHRGPISILSHKTHGSFFGRRLLPASIIVPIALGWIRLAAERAGLVSAPTALVLHVLASIAVMAFIVWLSALQLARASSKASHHWQSVSMVEDGYRKLLDLSGQPVFAVNTRGELTYANDAARAILFPSLQENPQEHSLVDWIGDAAWKDHFAPLLLGMQSASKLHNVLLRPFGSPELQADLHVVQLFRSETEFELLVCARKLRTSPEVLSQSFAAAAIPSTHLSGFATSRL